MKKILVFLTVLSVFVGLSGFVMADDSQILQGDVSDILMVEVLPSTLDFGAVPLDASAVDVGADVTINTAGSDTESNSVWVGISITDDADSFFTNLLEFDATADEPDAEWVDVATLGTLTISEGSSVMYHSRLNGNTVSFGAGPQTATIMYTITGLPPG